MSIKKETAEEIYKRGLEGIHDFCMNRDFNIYCSQILKDAEYFLKKGQQSNKFLKPTANSFGALSDELKEKLKN